MLRTTKQQVEITVEENEAGEYRLSGYESFHPTGDYKYMTGGVAAIEAHIASVPKPVENYDIYSWCKKAQDAIGTYPPNGAVSACTDLTEDEAVALMSLLERVAK